MKIKDSYHTYAIITILFWSMAYVLTRITLEYYSAYSLGFLRYIFASSALIVIAIIAKMSLPRKRDIKWFALSGAIGFFIYMIVFNKGCETVSSSTSSVVISTVPIITALLARLFLKEKLTVIKWIASVIELMGVIILTLMNHAFSMNHGVLWLLLASLALSFYNLLQRSLTKTYSGLQASAFSIFFGTIMLAIFLPESIRDVKSAPPMQMIYIIILGVFSSAIAYVAWAQAFKKAEKASYVSNYMFVTPFLASLLGFLISNEKPDMPTIIGGGVILVGVFIFNFGEKLFFRRRFDKNKA